MECIVCRRSLETGTRAKCASCRMEMHVTCTKVSEENWKKMNAERKSTWVGPCCTCLADMKSAREEIARVQTRVAVLETQNAQLFEDMQTQLNETLAKALAQIQDAVDRMANKCQETLQTQCDTICQKIESSIEKLVEGSERKPTINIIQSIPTYLDPLIASVPIFETDDPAKLLSFLDALYELHLTGGDHFAEIVKRIATTTEDKRLKRLVHECRDNLNFDVLSRRILGDFTNERTKLKMTADYLMRPQALGESFRDYVDCILRIGLILKSHEPAELIRFVLDGVNTRTRSFFNFQTTPKTLTELDTLANKVGKLEQAAQESLKSQKDRTELGRYYKSHISENSQNRPRSIRFDKNQPSTSCTPNSGSSACRPDQSELNDNGDISPNLGNQEGSRVNNDNTKKRKKFRPRHRRPRKIVRFLETGEEQNPNSWETERRNPD